MSKTGYILVDRIGPWKIVRHPFGTIYVSWYDPAARQVRRRTLKTKSVSTACAKVQELVDRNIQGDPREALAGPSIQTVRGVLGWHEAHVSTLASAEAEKIHIRQILASSLADRRLASLTVEDFDGLRDAWLTTGITVTTVGRRLSTLRSAINRAVTTKRLSRDDAPHVPEYRTKAVGRAAPTRGIICTAKELAELYDAISEPHLLLYMALLFSTGARSSALLELTGKQIDLAGGLLDLNPEGRVQTGKFRPVLPIQQHLRPWLTSLPRGRLITWHGAPVRSVKVGIRQLVARAGLPDGVNSYSVRHSVARHMRAFGVPTEEIAIWLGHIAPPANPETTLIYSRYAPAYLSRARAAVEAFVAEIAGRAETDLLTPPLVVTAYFTRLAGR